MIDDLIEAAAEVANDSHFSGKEIDQLLVALKAIELSCSQIELLDKIAECLVWSKEADSHVEKFVNALSEKIFQGR